MYLLKVPFKFCIVKLANLITSSGLFVMSLLVLHVDFLCELRLPPIVHRHGKSKVSLVY